MSNYHKPSPDARRHVMQLARMLILTANETGQVVTIERAPRRPLESGNFDYVVSVDPKRKTRRRAGTIRV